MCPVRFVCVRLESGKYSEKLLYDRFDAVAKSAIRMVFHLSMHDSDVAVLFGEDGIKPLSTLVDVAKLQWKHHNSKVVPERWISALHPLYFWVSRRRPAMGWI